MPNPPEESAFEESVAGQTDPGAALAALEDSVERAPPKFADDDGHQHQLDERHA
jgi:hypothetical protein